MKKILLFIILLTSLTFGQSELPVLFDDDNGYTIVNAETQVWYDKVVTAGGTVSDETLTAVDVFFQQLADSSLRSKMLRVNLICGDGLTSAGIPQILSDHKDSTTMGYTVDSLMNWVAGDYTELTGLGNAANTTKYIKTGFNPASVSELGLNSAGIGIYIMTNLAVTAQSGVLATNYFAVTPRISGDVSYFRVNAASAVGSVSTLSSLGYFDANRNASANQKGYYNGVLIQTDARTSSAKPNQVKGVFIFAINSGGSPANFDTRKLGAYTIHTGLDATEERALNNIIEAFQDALGRGVE